MSEVVDTLWQIQVRETMECQGSNCPSPGGAGAGTQIQASVFTVLLFGLASLLVLRYQNFNFTICV
uniref:Uncharacterized protein n=1 Tax=Magallana gigas TaxID=29159 RepID=K1R3D8_MAGGI